MQAKGYTYQQETSRQIGMEAMQNGLPGTGAAAGSASGAAGSVLGDMVGLGLTLGTVGTVVGMTKDTMSPIISDVAQRGKQAAAPSATWNCKCGTNGISSKFCPNCGQPMPAPAAPAPSAFPWNCSCGCANITSNFCPNCGKKNPNLIETWNCPNCNTSGIQSKFCPNCGHPKEA